MRLINNRILHTHGLGSADTGLMWAISERRKKPKEIKKNDFITDPAVFRFIIIVVRTCVRAGTRHRRICNINTAFRRSRGARQRDRYSSSASERNGYIYIRRPNFSPPESKNFEKKFEKIETKLRGLITGRERHHIVSRLIPRF